MPLLSYAHTGSNVHCTFALTNKQTTLYIHHFFHLPNIHKNLNPQNTPYIYVWFYEWQENIQMGWLRFRFSVKMAVFGKCLIRQLTKVSFFSCCLIRQVPKVTFFPCCLIRQLPKVTFFSCCLIRQLTKVSFFSCCLIRQLPKVTFFPCCLIRQLPKVTFFPCCLIRHFFFFVLSSKSKNRIIFKNLIYVMFYFGSSPAISATLALLCVISFRPRTKTSTLLPQVI